MNSEILKAIAFAAFMVFVWAATRREKPISHSEWLRRMKKQRLGTK